jgi:integrase
MSAKSNHPGLFRNDKTRFWQYSFRVAGYPDKFQGSTKTEDLSSAKLVLRDLVAAKTAELKAGVSREGAAMTIYDGARRYYDEVVSRWTHQNNVKAWDRYLDRLVDLVGVNVKLADIDTAMAQDLVRARQAQVAERRRAGKPVSNATVNHSVGRLLLKILRRARLKWQVPVREIERKEVLLKERVAHREVRSHEEEGLRGALPPAYALMLRFARISGLRRKECLIRWEDVDIGIGRIKSIGKGDIERSIPITTEMRRILEVCKVNNPTPYVFTTIYKGQVQPISYASLGRAMHEAKRRGLIPADMTFHSMRHDYGTKLLRATGNLALVQKALGHKDVKSTLRYAQVLDEDVAAAVEAHATAVAQLQRPQLKVVA